jgi:hypothetical protein
MKRRVAFMALACALVASTTASAAEVRFRGSFTIISIRDCLARYVGETFNSAFRPANVGDNPNITSLTQLNQYSGDVYELAGANLTLRRWINVEGHGFDNLHYSFPARIYMTQIAPAVIAPTTNYLNMTGYIYNMGADPGVDGKKCFAGFRASYFRRIE